MINRRTFLQLGAAASWTLALEPSERAAAQVGRVPKAAPKPVPKPIPKSKEPYRTALDTLKKELTEALERAQAPYVGGLKLHARSVDNTYRGLWPDDFLYPMAVKPGLYGVVELTELAKFLTESVADLERVPDRLQQDGVPVLQPGSLSEPYAEHMPLHLPAAWVRLLSFLEFCGVVIPQKDDWAYVLRRSFDQVPFSCGLVYNDPQRPAVGSSCQEPCAITGLTLMSSLIAMRGLERATTLLKGLVGTATLTRWTRQAADVRLNLYRLFEEKRGVFWAGTRDCRQADVWGNGLAYWLVEPAIRKRIVDFFSEHRDSIFSHGFTRQIIEPEGWERLLVEVPVGTSVNGGFWPAGTAWLLPAIADQDNDWGVELAKELVENVVRLKYPEWISADGKPGGARGYINSLAMPMLALTCILENRSLAECF